MNHNVHTDTKKFPKQSLKPQPPIRNFSRTAEQLFWYWVKGALTDEAGLSGPLRRTGTLETINQVLTGPPMTAGVHQTLVHIWDRQKKKVHQFMMLHWRSKEDLIKGKGFSRPYWWSRRVQSIRGHSDTQNPDWFPHSFLHSNRGWTDRHGPLRQAETGDV